MPTPASNKRRPVMGPASGRPATTPKSWKEVEVDRRRSLRPHPAGGGRRWRPCPALGKEVQVGDGARARILEETWRRPVSFACSQLEGRWRRLVTASAAPAVMEMEAGDFNNN